MSLAFIFPGQGSQAQGMLSDLAATYAEVADVFAEASTTLGYDLWKITQQGPIEKLNQTEITQPAMLAAGVAAWRVWQGQGGLMPEIMAGHSLGEYTALVCADSLNLADAVELVAERGRLMQQAVPAGTGAMAAILGLADDVVCQVCEDVADGDVVAAVNFNSPGQVVIAGHSTAVDRAIGLAKERGAKRALLLPVSVPSHCALMKPAAEKLAARLEQTTLQAPHFAVMNNVDATVQTDPDAIRDALTRQLYQPVRWAEIIQKMSAQGIDQLVECGPGKVLVGLNKRIDKSMKAHPALDTATMKVALEAVVGKQLEGETQ